MSYRDDIRKLHKQVVLKEQIFFRVIDLQNPDPESDEEFVLRMNGNLDSALVIRAEV
jgi:hypothetical protein